MDVKALENLIKMLNKQGVRSYKTPELELALDGVQNEPKKALDASKDAKEESEYTEEQMLNWSSAPQNGLGS